MSILSITPHISVLNCSYNFLTAGHQDRHIHSTRQYSTVQCSTTQVTTHHSTPHHIQSSPPPFTTYSLTRLPAQRYWKTPCPRHTVPHSAPP